MYTQLIKSLHQSPNVIKAISEGIEKAKNVGDTKKENKTNRQI